MKNIYVVLPRSETFIAKIGRLLTNYEYSHVTISFDDNLKEFYSFSRIYNDAPIISGFVKEYRSHLVNNPKARLKCKIFKLSVSEKVYKKIKLYCKSLLLDKTLLFNYVSMLLLPLNGGIKVVKSYNCTHFVAEVLSMIPYINLKKEKYKYKPKDFELLLQKKYFYFEGYLNIDDNRYNDDIYFNKVPLKKKIIISLYYLKETLHRLLLKKESNNFDNKKYM